MIDSVYFRQAELILRVLPLVDREAAFALKGGTAINFFVRDLPRISVDIDLVYLPVGERDSSLRELSAGLVRISREVESRIPRTKIIPKRLKGTDLWSGCSVQREDATIKIEPNLVMRGSLLPPERRTLSPKARSVFELSVECRMLAESELYAGKLCAALAQHPDVIEIFHSAVELCQIQGGLELFRHDGFDVVGVDDGRFHIEQRRKRHLQSVGYHGITKPDIDLHGDSRLAEPGVELEPYPQIFRVLRHRLDAQMVEFLDEAVVECGVSDLADRSADGIDISRTETQKIDVPRRSCHRETHAHQ